MKKILHWLDENFRRIYYYPVSDRDDTDHGHTGLLPLCAGDVLVLVRRTDPLSLYLVWLFKCQLL